MTQHKTNQLVLMHHDRYLFSVVSDVHDIEFEVSGPDTLVRCRNLHDASEVWQQIIKRVNKKLEQDKPFDQKKWDSLRGIMF